MKRGLSVIESIVAVAILAIVMLLMSPMVKNYGLVYDRINLQNRIDYEFGKTLEIIKRKVKASRIIDTGDLASVANAIEIREDLTTSPKIISELRLLVPNDTLSEDKNYIAFRIEENSAGERRLVYVTNPKTASGVTIVSTAPEGTPVELIEYLEDGGFEYKNGVVLIYLDLDIDRMTGENIEGKRNIQDKIRDSAVTRINIDMSKNY
ncbi:prepilin-type N-terminal cleavage/methylation domain-containing protein [uncultured Ilyobacter sp.]|uniref:prepilin-type N-terminal cleavage/methylation domain-containing protein n=1 Tax=uncultured Ilyobacter sp. TaxID=544433 RepID=UPI0029C92E00|nr:prepilin-type N-terminal cleavage/methylation domain-containing protein [uncultured Ilyobacter sp.]